MASLLPAGTRSAGFDAVVTDLDGTVVRRDGTVSEATMYAAHVLKDQGIPLLAATARTPAGVEALHTLSPLMTFAVCSSGAIGYLPATATLAWCERIPPDVAVDLLAFVARRLPSAGLAAFDGVLWRMTAAYQIMRPSGHKGPALVVPAAALLTVDPCAMVVCHPERSAPQVIAFLTEAGFGANRLGLTYAGPRFVEVTAARVDKATGVLRALHTIDIQPEHVIAFGDMPNDIATFSAVGSSVAMGNAPDEVRNAATMQTASVEDDGFASMLAHLNLVPRGSAGPTVLPT